MNCSNSGAVLSCTSISIDWKRIRVAQAEFEVNRINFVCLIFAIEHCLLIESGIIEQNKSFKCCNCPALWSNLSRLDVLELARMLAICFGCCLAILYKDQIGEDDTIKQRREVFVS